jgi:RNA polymerase sigma factor (sigma-70 family)
MCAVRADTPDDTELARRATGGDGQAFGLLFDRWLDRAFDVAWHVVHNRETAADVTQEAFASAWQQIGNLRQPESFGGWLLRITRNKALNRLQRERRSSPTGSEEALVTLDARQADDPSAPLEQREHGDLIWAASAALGEEDASLLSLHLRHDLGAPELAEELGVQPNAVHQRLFRLKKRLADAIGAWVLWRGGGPSCPELSAALERAEATSFDRGTAKAIVTHTRGCDACDRSRQLRLSPEALFAAMPLVPAGPVLRAKMAAALQAHDIPVPSPEPADPQSPGQVTERSDPPGPDDATEPVDSQAAELNEGLGDTQTPPDTSQPSDAQASEQTAEMADQQSLETSSEPEAQGGQADAGTPDGPTPPDKADGPHDASAPADKAGRPHDAGAPGIADGQAAASEPQRPGTVEVAQASPSWRGRRAGLIGGAVVVGVLAGVALLLTLLANRAGDGTTVETQAPAATVTEATEQERRTTTTPTSDHPTTTAEPTTTTTTTTTTPDDEATAPGPADAPTETAAPAGTTAPAPADEPGGTGDGNGDAVEPPTIGNFTARATDLPCGSAGEIEAVFAWETSHATSATLAPQGGPPAAVAPTGNLTRCARPGSTWVLTASGPGGTADAQATVPTSPALATP